MSEEKRYLVYVRDHAGRVRPEIHHGIHYHDQKIVKVLARHALEAKHDGFDIEELALLFPYREAKR